MVEHKSFVQRPKSRWTSHSMNCVHSWRMYRKLIEWIKIFWIDGNALSLFLAPWAVTIESIVQKEIFIESIDHKKTIFSIYSIMNNIFSIDLTFAKYISNLLLFDSIIFNLEFNQSADLVALFNHISPVIMRNDHHL